MTGEDQQSDLTAEEHGNLGETLKGPETVTGFCQKDLGGTGTASFIFLRSCVQGEKPSTILQAASSFCWLNTT
jgi:hypothetical protein